MFRSKTVFILGAGASAEVGLPVGSGLLKHICDLINIKYDHRMISGDHQVSEALKRIINEGSEVSEYNHHLYAAWQVIQSANQALSIDNIVDGLEDPKVELVSKLGIARAIQISEAKSQFFQTKKDGTDRLYYSKFQDTWYDKLTKLICENRRKSELEKFFENLAFISFNYDRCIEAYLPGSVANYYGYEVPEVLNSFLKAPLVRPYGIAGELKWNRSSIPVGFGGNGTDYLINAARQIRTFTEGVQNDRLKSDITRVLEDASRVVFLGSAFHRQNLELLRTKLNSNVEVYATASSISKSDLEVIRGELADVFSMNPARIEFANVYCNEFFERYWRTLTAK